MDPPNNPHTEAVEIFFPEPFPHFDVSYLLPPALFSSFQANVISRIEAGVNETVPGDALPILPGSFCDTFHLTCHFVLCKYSNENMQENMPDLG